jgi:hypothetical protein
MARRKRTNEEGVSMDSLMDALTNVVAVLIVILILLQTDVSNQVEKLLNDLKPASVEDLANAKQKKQSLASQIKTQKNLLNAPKASPDDIKKVELDLSLLEKSISQQNTTFMELAKLQNKVEEQKVQETSERTKTESILKEIANTKALLDQTPVPKPPSATVVSLPNSRPIPESAKIFHCFIVNDQVHLVDADEAKKMVMDEMKTHESKLILTVKKVPKKPDEKVFDQEKTVAHFRQRNLKLRQYNITVPYNKPWPILNMVITFDPTKGDANLEELQQAKGRFHNACKFIRSQSDSIIMFRVNTNGFATYLKAREIADSFNIPCGWEIHSSHSHSERLDFRVNNLEEPPKNPGPKQPTIKPKLD